MERGWLGKTTAEFVATFGLVFFGAGSLIVDHHLVDVRGLDGFGLLGVAAVHAVVLAVMVTATMNLSGGHVNPVVSIAAWLTRKLSAPLAGAYVAAQLAGGILAVAFLRALLPLGSATATSYGATLVAADIGALQALTLELVLTFFLVFTYWATVISKREPAVGGFAVGMVLFFTSMVGGIFTGASLNPARSLGPALFAGDWTLHWIYWIGPILGGALAAAAYEGIVEKGAPEDGT